MKKEIWKDIKGYEGFYEVSNKGRVKSLKRKYRRSDKILKAGRHTDGGEQVVLWKSGKRSTKKVHRLVADAFIPNPNKKPQVNHKNLNKHDNRVSNLEWCDAAYNNRHARAARDKGAQSGC